MRKRVGRKWSWACHAVAAVLYSIIAGAIMVWPTLQNEIPLEWFFAGGIGLNVAGAVIQLVDRRSAR